MDHPVYNIVDNIVIGNSCATKCHCRSIIGYRYPLRPTAVRNNNNNNNNNNG